MNSNPNTTTSVSPASAQQVKRAHMLFEAAEYRMQNFGAALHAQGTTLPAPKGFANIGTGLSNQLRDIEQAAEGEIVAAHERLQRAQTLSADAERRNARLNDLYQRLYGAAPPDAETDKADDNVIDVQARVVPRDTPPADTNK